MELEYFFDTYALFEIVHDSKNYSKYKNCSIKTTMLNLMKLHYRLLSLYGEKVAEKSFNAFLPFAQEFTEEDIKQANKIKLKFKKQKLSYVDCLSYIMSLKLGLKFLTGDKKFEYFPEVEFVK
jgi:predicted nucleic acid-binding protein